MPQFMHDGGESIRMGRERKAQERLQKRQRVRETGAERKGHRETKRKRKRESKKERWRESDRFGERIAGVSEKGHRDREDERFDGEIVRMRAVIERRRHRESRYERAPLVLVGRMKEIRHGEGSSRFVVAGSLGDHFCLNTLRILLCGSAIPARSNTKMVSISKSS